MQGPGRAPRLILVSGCSGGGKSTLLDGLAARGVATVAEPGRRVIAAERAGGGNALPWADLAAFAGRALAMARADRQTAQGSGAPVVAFDRGIIDAKVALARACGVAWAPDAEDRDAYHRDMFLVPPWPELFAGDADRRHDFAAACDEYDRLAAGFAAAGYRCRMVPRLPLGKRVAWLAGAIGI